VGRGWREASGLSRWPWGLLVVQLLMAQVVILVAVAMVTEQ